jgi:hypothetical protein
MSNTITSPTVKIADLNKISAFRLKQMNNNVISQLLQITDGAMHRLFDGREQVIDAALRLLVRDLKEQFGVADEASAVQSNPDTLVASGGPTEPGDAGDPKP